MTITGWAMPSEVKYTEKNIPFREIERDTVYNINQTVLKFKFPLSGLPSPIFITADTATKRILRIDVANISVDSTQIYQCE